MSIARLVVMAVVVEGRPKAAVAREYGVSRRWVHEIIRRYETEGEAGLEPRSRRPRTSPHRTPAGLEDEIVGLREELTGQGLDAGAHTIWFHLIERHGTAPAPSTIWRVLSRRGLVEPHPQKRPKKLLRPVLRGPAERAVAGGRHPLGARRRFWGGDLQLDRRPLPAARRL